jgi:hypothetical protein
MRHDCIEHAALQVGDRLFVQLPGAAGVIASPVVAIESVIRNSAFNLQTLRGEICPEIAKPRGVLHVPSARVLLWRSICVSSKDGVIDGATTS